MKSILTAAAALTLSLTATSNAKDLPQKSIAELANYSQSALRQDGIVKPKDMILYGAVVDGVHYVSDCREKMNCDNRSLPSYSIAKSIFAGFTLMMLEKQYKGAKDALIADYIPQCKAAGWGNVTFNNLLDMVSGHYQDPKNDEKKIIDFLVVPTNEEKNSAACFWYKKQRPAGEKFYYRTVDTWLLGMGMQRFWAEKSRNPKADLYNDLIAPLWKELGLSDTVTIERSEGKQPYSGTGLFFNRADIAKVAHALANYDNRIISKLDPDMLEETMKGTDGGYGIITHHENQNYENGFWGFNAGKHLGCKETLWIPYMSGFGGKMVLMFPTGDIYYYFSSGHVYEYKKVVEEFHKQKPLCK